MDPLRVACAVEGAYDAYSAAMLRSVALNAGGLEVEVYYLHGPDFPGRSVDRIRSMLRTLGVRSVFLEIDPRRIEGLPVVPLFTAAMWFRIYLPELLPEADKVLYLDVDTMVVSSLEPLWELDLGGHHVAAVTNVFMREHEGRPAELGLAGPGRYFNSGVLLMNLAAMRRDHSTAALREYAMGRALEWPDQDALNVVLGATRLPLHPRWNVTNSMWFPWSSETFGDKAAAAREDPGIRHFEGQGDNKPWRYDSGQPYRDLYLDHLRRTPWRGQPLEGQPRWRAAAGRARRRIIGGRRGEFSS